MTSKRRSSTCRTEIRDALHAPNDHDPRIADGLCTGTRLADGTSARGLAAPPPHRCRDCASSGLPRIFRRAYTVVSYLFASRKPSGVIHTIRIDAHHSHRRRRISLPRRHRHRPPIRLGRASYETDRAVPPSDPSASSSYRRMLQLAASGRSALGRTHKRDASGEHRVSCLCSPPFSGLNVLPRRK